MKRNELYPWAAIAAVFFAACGAPADNPPVRSANTAEANPIADAPTANALLAIEREANEAYFKGEAAFFEGQLSDQFVMLGPGGARMDKAATTGTVAGVRCDVKDGWTLDEPRLSTIDADTYVLTYRGTFDGTCTLNGRTEKTPSPVRAATVWIRSGEKWLAAFHGENPIFDPRAAVPPAETAADKEAPNEGDKTASDARPAAPAADPSTDAMVAIETSVWEAWKARDAEVLEELTARDLAFVDIFGNVTSGKAETIKFWTEHQCDVQCSRGRRYRHIPLGDRWDPDVQGNPRRNLRRSGVPPDLRGIRLCKGRRLLEVGIHSESPDELGVGEGPRSSSTTPCLLLARYAIER